MAIQAASHNTIQVSSRPACNAGAVPAKIPSSRP